MALCKGVKNDDYETVKKLLEMGTNVSTANFDGDTPLHLAKSSQIGLLLLEHKAPIKARNKEGKTPLHVAASKGLDALVKTLLENGADPAAVDNNKNTPLHVASTNDVGLLLVQHKAPVNSKDSSGNTPLHLAARKGLDALTKALLENGADPAAVDDYKNTPLHVASTNDVGLLLVQHKAPVNSKDSSGKTPLHFAASKGLDALTKALLENGADPAAFDDYKYTPLHFASTNNVGLLLLQHKAPVDVKGAYGKTPLHSAAKNGLHELTKALLDNGADPAAVDEEQNTPLHYAKTSDVGLLLVQHKSPVNTKDADDKTPLHLAVSNSLNTVVIALLENGADPAAVDRYKLTPLHYASTDDVGLLLVQHNAPVNGHGWYGDTPLHIAARNSLCKLTKALLENGADPAAVDNNKNTPLHYASTNEVGLLLLQHKTPINVISEDGRSLLHSAVGKGLDALAKALLENGADPAAVDNNKYTPLHCACTSDVALLLVQHKALVNVKANDGKTPLHLAVSNSLNAVVIALLENGADPAAVDEDKNTPLHYAKTSDVGLLLVQHKAPVNVKGENGKTPLHIAASNGWDALTKALLDNGADPAAVDGYINTPLHCASTNEVGFLLLQHNAPVNAKRFSGETPLHIAASEGLYELAKALLENGADPVAIDMYKNTPLHRTSTGNVALLLLQHKAPVNAKGNEGKTPLHIAAEKGLDELTETLLENGADASFVDEKNMSVFDTMLMRDVNVALSLLKSSTKPKIPASSLARLVTFQPSQNNFLQECKIDGFNANIDFFKFCLDEIESSRNCSLYDIAHSPTADGRLLLEVALPEYKNEINARIRFFQRFDILSGPPLHISSTCVVVAALDYDDAGKPFRVALKFMKNHNQYEQEKAGRINMKNNNAVVQVNDYFDTREFQIASAKHFGNNNYPYAISMPLADRSLSDILMHEHIAGSDFAKIRVVLREIAECLQQLHTVGGIIHGDIKPLNIVRVENKIKLIDLDACASLVEKGAKAGLKYSSGYVPPEMINSDGDVQTVDANVAIDVWSFGVVAFELFSGQSLFQIDQNDNIPTSEDRLRLKYWSKEKSKKLSLLPATIDMNAYNLLSRCLMEDPTHRFADMSQILAHPFISGAKLDRMYGQQAIYSYFQSYRVDADTGKSKSLYEAAVATKELTVFWDSKSLLDGEEWEKGFCVGLMQSDVFVPIISTNAISRMKKLTKSSNVDNVLLEWRLALELAHPSRNFLKQIIPVFVYDDVLADSFVLGDVIVDKLEEKLRETMQNMNLGKPLRKPEAPNATFQYLKKIAVRYAVKGNNLEDKRETVFNSKDAQDIVTLIQSCVKVKYSYYQSHHAVVDQGKADALTHHARTHTVLNPYSASAPKTEKEPKWEVFLGCDNFVPIITPAALMSMSEAMKSQTPMPKADLNMIVELRLGLELFQRNPKVIKKIFPVLVEYGGLWSVTLSDNINDEVEVTLERILTELKVEPSKPLRAKESLNATWAELKKIQGAVVREKDMEGRVVYQGEDSFQSYYLNTILKRVADLITTVKSVDNAANNNITKEEHDRIIKEKETLQKEKETLQKEKETLQKEKETWLQEKEALQKQLQQMSATSPQLASTSNASPTISSSPSSEPLTQSSTNSTSSSPNTSNAKNKISFFQKISSKKQ